MSAAAEDAPFALRVAGLGKRFQLRHGAAGTLRETLMAGPARWFGRGSGAATTEEFWALRDVSFEIRPGEVVGLIGRNGAGKSTLLKILSRVLEPTRGEALVRGRIGSLLEVGTGFHGELTGRENIYLSGALLGMRRAEVRRRFDEIVAFAGVDQFLDTPCKHYSSGMYTRLGFAVAAHLDAEILLVDEVLAVGDAEFQKRCLGRMRTLAGDGRTVLLVSHQMAAIRTVCPRTICLADGRVARDGPTEAVLAFYHGSVGSAAAGPAGGPATLRTCDGQALARSDFSMGESIGFEIRLSVPPAWAGRPLRLAVELSTDDGVRLANMVDIDSGFQLAGSREHHLLRVTLDDLRLYPGAYVAGLWVGDPGSVDVCVHLERAATFNITDGGRLTMRRLPRTNGLFFFTPRWSEVRDGETGS